MAENSLGPVVARKKKISDEKEFAAQIAAAMASGENPISAVTSALDTDKDGRLTLGELRDHRWKLIIYFAGIVTAAILLRPFEIWGFVTNHWLWALTIVCAAVAGWFVGWMFRAELKHFEEKLEDKTIGEVAFGSAATAANAVTSGDPGAALATAATIPAVAATAAIDAAALTADQAIQQAAGQQPI